MSQQRQPLCLLALDGGGVRGLSELIVLKELMLRVQKHRSLESPPKPCELFDLIGGTSTGGLIAIMLGRLKMSVDEVFEEYCNVGKEVFGKPKRSVSEGTFSASTFEKAIKKVVERYGSPKGENGKASPELKLLEEGNSTSICKVFVCSRNARAMDVARLFRSYRSYTAGDYEDMTIWQAARGTSAAPTFFKRLKIGQQGAQEEFLDGGLGSNNPTKLLMEEAVKIFDQDSVACIISIGTGKTNVTEFKAPGFFQKALPTELISALKNITTDCETVEREISQRFSANPGTYFRFNVEHGLENVSLEEWKEFGNIKAKTVAYLEDHRVARSVNEAVVALCDRSPRRTVSALEFVFPSATHKAHTKRAVCSEPVCVVPFTQRIDYFIGRTDLLQKLHSCFNGEDRDPARSVILVLCAMGGQGKTQVALEYCQRARNENYDHILWANAENQSSLQQSFVQFAEALGMSQDRDKPGLKRSAVEHLSPLEYIQECLSGLRYLLVVDNTDEPEKIGNIKAYMELGGIGDIIITSRHLDAVQLGTQIPIPPFSQEEGRGLLSRRSGRGDSSDSASDTKDLINALGGLPLGLDQAAAFIRETNLSYRQFLKKFQEAQEILLDDDLPEFWEYKKAVQENRIEPEQRRKIGIHTTWKMSFDYLKSRPNGPSKCHLLTLSAHLDSKSISQASFTPWLKFIDRASSKRKASNESPRDSSTSNSTEESALEYSASWARPLLQDLGPNSREFLKFIQDAYKIGLISSMHHDDIMGVLFSIHPLVSRWLRSSRDKDHILEAIFVTFHLVRDLDKIPNLTSLHYEVGRHVLACIDSNVDLPENLHLGIGDLRIVGLKFVSFATTSDVDLSEVQFEILRAALSSDGVEFLELEYDEYPDRAILHTMGYARMKSGDYEEAKELLLQAKSRTPIWMIQFAASIFSDLIVVYIKQHDEKSLQWIFRDLVNGFDFLSQFGKNEPELNPRSWITLFHQVTISFGSHYDLSTRALTSFLELIGQRLFVNESEELGMIELIVEYYLGLSYFQGAQFREAQNTFSSILRKTSRLTYSECVLFLEVGSHFFNGAAQCRVDGKDVVGVPSETLQQFSSARLLTDSNKAILEEIEAILSVAVKFMPSRSVDAVWKANLLLRNIVIPPWQLDDKDDASTNVFKNMKVVSSRMTSALFTKTLEPNMLQEAETALMSYIEHLGNCKATERLETLVSGGHWMLGNFESCLRVCLNRTRRRVDNGQAPGSTDIRMIGRCFIRLGRLDDLEKHKEQYPNEDWDLLQEEENQKRDDTTA